MDPIKDGNVTLDKGIKWNAVLLSEGIDPEDKFTDCRWRSSFMVTCDGAEDCLDESCSNRILSKVVAFDGAVVRKSREGKGYGLFAKREIAKGEPMLEYGGIVMTRDKADSNDSVYKLQYHKGRYVVDAEKSDCLARYVNHACQEAANTKVEQLRVLDRIAMVLIADRNIKKGEEITFEYNENFSKLNDCLCSKCREAALTCTLCPEKRVFKRKRDLDDHILRHQGIRFFCDKCISSFTSRSARDRHRSHHKNRGRFAKQRGED